MKAKNKNDRTKVTKSPKKKSVPPKKNEVTEKTGEPKGIRLSLDFQVSTWTTWGLDFLFFLFCWWYAGVLYGNYMYVAQNYDLFRYSYIWLLDQYFQPQGGLTLFTSFMVQFFYRPIWGGLVIAVMLWAIRITAGRLFRLRGPASLLTWLLPLLVLSTVIQPSYAIFNVLNIPRLFGLIPGVLIALLIPLFCTAYTSWWKRCLALVLTLLVLFPHCGAYTLLGGLLCVILEGKQPSTTRRTLRLESVLLIVLSVPLFWYPFFYDQNTFVRLYYGGIFPDDSKFASVYVLLWQYWLSFLLLFLLMIYLTVIAVPFVSEKETIQENKSISRERQSSEVTVTEESRRSSVWNAVAPWLVMVIFMGATYWWTPHSDGLFCTLELYRPLEEEDWDGILAREKNCQDPTRGTVMLRNLALFEKDELADRIFERSLKAEPTELLINVSSYRIYGSQVLFNMGQTNYAAWLGTNNRVDQPNTAAVMKLFVQIAAVEGNFSYAEHFLRPLESSYNHARWAKTWRKWFEEQEKAPREIFNEKPVTETGSPETERITRRIKKLRTRQPRDDYFAKMAPLEFILYEMAQHDGFSRMTPEMQKLFMVYTLVDCGKNVFMKKIDRFIESWGKRPLPRSFQEAWIIFRFQDQKEPIAPTPYVLPETLDRFYRYMELGIKRGNDIKNPVYQEESRKFDDTFWSYYFGGGKFNYY